MGSLGFAVVSGELYRLTTEIPIEPVNVFCDLEAYSSDNFKRVLRQPSFCMIINE